MPHKGTFVSLVQLWSYRQEIKDIARITAPWSFETYAHIISRISDKDGGGYLITFPDLPGCMADGQTEAEAVGNGRNAFAAALSALADMGRDIPAPAHGRPNRLLKYPHSPGLISFS